MSKKNKTQYYTENEPADCDYAPPAPKDPAAALRAMLNQYLYDTDKALALLDALVRERDEARAPHTWRPVSTPPPPREHVVVAFADAHRGGAPSVAIAYWVPFFERTTQWPKWIEVFGPTERYSQRTLQPTHWRPFDRVTLPDGTIPEQVWRRTIW